MKIFMIIAVLVLHPIEESHSVCNEQGVFVNPNDNSCQSYIFCLPLSGGVFIEKQYLCPNGSMFNPSKKNCDEKFDCITPTTISLVTEVPKANFECAAQGKFALPNDPTCTHYFFCFYLPSGKYIMKNYTCPLGSKFNPKLQTCSKTYNCNNSPSTTTTVSHVSSTEVPTSFNCTKQGRFPVEEDLNCRSYHECFYLPNGTFIEKVYSCPSGLGFDPKTQTCNANYQCTQFASSTTQSINFNCPTTGRFPDDADSTCKGYFYCVRLPNGNLGFQNYNCPEGEIFDAQQKTCSSTHRCNSSSVTSTTPSTTATTTEINCTKQGRFPVQEDETCQLYYLCVNSGDGKFAQQIFICPNEQKFNPQTQNCSSNYHCTKDSPTSTTLINNFLCPTKGRFPDDTDKTCRRYFYCVYQPNEELGFQIFSCPEGENFDPKLQLCKENYNCSTQQALTLSSESKETTTFSILTVPPREKTTEIYLSTAFNETSDGSSRPSDIITKIATVNTQHSSDMNGISDIIQTISSTDPISDDFPLQDISTDNLIDISTEKTVTEETKHSKDTTDIYTTYFTTDAETIICKSIGNLQDTSDETCQSYFVCEARPNGELKAIRKKCEFQLFDPKLGECSSTYSCHHDSGKILTMITREFSSSETKEYYTSDNTFRSTFSSTIDSQNPDFTTDVDRHDRNTDNCVIDDDIVSGNPVQISSNIPRISSSMAEVTTAKYISNGTRNFGIDSCKSVGRFSIMDDRTCKTYYLCLVGPNDDLISFRYSCIFGELFDPVLGKCSTTYTCDRAGNQQAIP